MHRKQKPNRSAFLLSLLLCYNVSGRSVHRPKDPDYPAVKAYWKDQEKAYEYASKDSHLQDAMFKLYDENHFNSNLLPKGAINFRYEPEKSVNGQTLCDLIEELIIEISHLKKKQRKITFKHFSVLKKKDINKSDHTGLYVVKFNDYPFIVKLFIETPQGVCQPLYKGFEPICFYYLAGLSRHFNGFTRIKNLENIKKIIQADPYWSQKVGFPRKWFGLPKNPQWITIEGENIGTNRTSKVTIPAIYFIVCDEIIWKKPFTLSDPDDKKAALELSNFLEHRIDSHINNFGIEIKTNKIVPIDFEHFITSVGIEGDYYCDNYYTWYKDLTCNMVSRLMFRNKLERRRAQYKGYIPIT